MWLNLSMPLCKLYKYFNSVYVYQKEGVEVANLK